MDEQTLNPRERACPICGKKDFEWGRMIISTNSPHGAVYFRPDRTTGEDSDIPVYARHCVTCDNIQVFVIES